MNFFKSSTGLFTLAFIVLFTTNLVILSGVYINQNSETTSELKLTHRELITPYFMTKENNNPSLKIQYRTLKEAKDEYSNYINDYKWLNETKLQELGFDTKRYKTQKTHDNSLAKEVFVVLEYNGKTYQKSIQNSQNYLEQKKTLLQLEPTNKRAIQVCQRAENNLQKELNTNSRLFAIDTGLSYEALREKYSGKHKFLITKGIVNIAPYNQDTPLHGYLSGLSVENIYIPYKFKKELSHSLPQAIIEVKYGSKFEPYISTIELIK